MEIRRAGILHYEVRHARGLLVLQKCCSPGRTYAVCVLIVAVILCPANSVNLDGDCRQPATCYPIANSSSCFGASFTYNATSTNISHHVLLDQELSEWIPLRHVPRCWSLLQPFLCSVFMPPCKDNITFLPSERMCKTVHSVCAIVEKVHGKWPSSLQCNKFPKEHCIEEVQTLQKFNISGECAWPLVATQTGNDFPLVQGCGLNCQYPLFSAKEFKTVHQFTAILACFTCFCCFISVATYLMQWSDSSNRRYPRAAAFWMCGCFWLGTIGWLIQFGDRESVVCRRDGTARLAEPTTNSSPGCMSSFFLIYYFSIAASGWFVIYAYCWNVSLKQRSSPDLQVAIKGKLTWFHIICWTFPLVLAVVCLAVAGVDGSWLHGICMVGYERGELRLGLLLAPITVCLFVGCYFFFQGILTLSNVDRERPGGLITDKASKHIRTAIVKTTIFVFMSFTVVTSSFVCHFYNVSYSEEWKESILKLAVCKARSKKFADFCMPSTKPNIHIEKYHLSLYFLAAIMSSVWLWNKSTFTIWKTFTLNVIKKVQLRRKIEKNRKIPNRQENAEIVRYRCKKRISWSLQSAPEEENGKIQHNSMYSMDSQASEFSVVTRQKWRRGKNERANRSIRRRRRSRYLQRRLSDSSAVSKITSRSIQFTMSSNSLDAAGVASKGSLLTRSSLPSMHSVRLWTEPPRTFAQFSTKYFVNSNVEATYIPKQNMGHLLAGVGEELPICDKQRAAAIPATPYYPPAESMVFHPVYNTKLADSFYPAHVRMQSNLPPNINGASAKSSFLPNPSPFFNIQPHVRSASVNFNLTSPSPCFNFHRHPYFGVPPGMQTNFLLPYGTPNMGFPPPAPPRFNNFPQFLNVATLPPRYPTPANYCMTPGSIQPMFHPFAYQPHPNIQKTPEPALHDPSFEPSLQPQLKVPTNTPT